MPVLRSRQTPFSPPPPPPSSDETKSRSTPTVVEPPTPAKTGELASQSLMSPPYRRRSRRICGADAVGPTPKRSRNDLAWESKELDDYSGGRVRVRVSDDRLDRIQELGRNIDAVGPTPKRSQNNDVALESKESDVRVRVSNDRLDGSQESGQKIGEVEEIRVLSLRSGTRVAKRVSFGSGGGGDNSRNFDLNRDDGVDFDSLIGKICDDVQKLVQSEGDNQGEGEIEGLSLWSGATVTKRLSIGGGGGGDDGGNVGGNVVDDVQELGQRDGVSRRKGKNEVLGLRSSARVAKRLSMGGGDGGGGDGDNLGEIGSKVDVEEVKDGVLERSGSKKKTRMSVRRYSGEEKGKGKVSLDDEMGEDGVKEKVDVSPLKQFVSVDDQGLVHSMDDDDFGLIRGDGSELRSPRRYTREEKGKEVVTSDDAVMDDKGDDNNKDVLENGNVELGLDHSGLDVNFDVGAGANGGFNLEGRLTGLGNYTEDDYRESRLQYMKEQHKCIAKRNARKYAHFNMEDDEGQGRGEEDGEDSEGETDVPTADRDVNAEEWPGPFSTAMKIIRDREKNLGKGAQNSCSVKEAMPLISWTPKKERGSEVEKRTVPSLQSMCLKILAQNVDAISSLTYVPEVLRHKLCQMLCDSRRMNAHFFSLLLEGSPSEIRVADSSWLEEEEFEKSIKGCDTSNLTVLQLDLCGHCVSDVSLLKTVAPKGFPKLTTISLKGACRISDLGLNAIISAAPVLRSMNLSQCSLLTASGINTIADKLGSIVHELYLDDCDTLDAMKILPSLKRLLHLEVLSLRGIGGVSDKFIRKLLTSNGQNMKELVLANCVNLTNASLKVIAEKCPQLCVLDLSYLRKLTDIGMAHLTDGCRGIQDLRLCRNALSDDAIAAFLEASGESLKELSLNNITKVGQNTTISLARRCKNLETLDLSWCRSLTDDALGLIADSCMSLRLLKIFGCTQITRTFLDGHSNPHLHIVGMKLTPILEHIKRPDFQQGPLYYSAVPSP